MAKGRPPDPNRASRQTGHRALPGQAKPVEIVPGAPFDISPPPELNPEAVPLWEVAVAELLPKGLTEADLPMVEMMVTAAHRNRQARRLVDKSVLLMRSSDERGRIALNPLLKLEKDTAATYLRLAESLGLSPAARARLGLMHLAGQSLLVDIAERVAKASQRPRGRKGDA